jgi:glutamine amidotransferase PdxT
LANRFQAIDIVVKRNVCGRQLGCFSIEVEMKGIGIVPMIFICAPYSFHPEQISDMRIHEYFREIDAGSGSKKCSVHTKNFG